MKTLLANIKCTECDQLLAAERTSCDKCAGIKFTDRCLIVDRVSEVSDPSPSPFFPKSSRVPTPPNWRTLCFLEIKNFLNTLGPSRGDTIDLGSGPLTNSSLLDPDHTLFIDGCQFEGVDIVTDFSKPLPLPNSCCDTLICSNVLEHMMDPALLMNEITRLLKHGGQAIVLVPFIIKIHQAPIDFFRLTKFAIINLVGSEHELTIKEIGGTTNIKKTLLSIEKLHCNTFWERLFISLEQKLVYFQALLFRDKIIESIPQGYSIIIKASKE